MSVIPATRGMRKGLRGAVLSLLQKDADPDAREHGEQEGGESADQEVLGELAVLQGLEAGERLGGDDPAHRAVLPQQDEGEGEGALEREIGRASCRERV